MIGLRHKSLRRFGAALAGIAVYLQLAFASLGMLAMATPSEPADGFAGHALCLAAAGGTTQSPAPADSIPTTPVHDHLAFCCLWHSTPGFISQLSLVPLPVAYAGIRYRDSDNDTFIPGRQRGPANARAPPTLA
jgi:hypothetical protein